MSQLQNNGGVKEGLNHEMFKVNEESLEGVERKRECLFCSRKQSSRR